LNYIFLNGFNLPFFLRFSNDGTVEITDGYDLSLIDFVNKGVICVCIGGDQLEVIGDNYALDHWFQMMSYYRKPLIRSSFSRKSYSFSYHHKGTGKSFFFTSNFGV